MVLNAQSGCLLQKRGRVNWYCKRLICAISAQPVGAEHRSWLQAYLQGLPLPLPQYGSHADPRDTASAQLPRTTPDNAEKAIQQLMSTPEVLRPSKAAGPLPGPPSRNPANYCKGVVFPKVIPPPLQTVQRNKKPNYFHIQLGLLLMAFGVTDQGFWHAVLKFSFRRRENLT